MPKESYIDLKSTEPFPFSDRELKILLIVRVAFILRKGKDQSPSGPQFLLNSGLTHSKERIRLCRKKKIPHPLMIKNNINAIPFSH
ncbi:MAG: hypothetical protein CM15mP93_08140 [Thiotrichaceae bacterium]|nr:MAG: hypothetical protein CM15mP93_08140 [Thiotrichaceae bacterium]